MKKLKKLFIIGCLLMVVVNVGFATMQYMSDNIPTAYAADEDGDCLDDVTGEAVADCTPPAEGEGGEEPAAGESESEIVSPDEIADTLSQGARSLLLRFSDLLAIILQMLNYLLWPILMMIGALMDNSIIFGGGMEDRLLQIWSQIRNIVNLLFVVILIAMAIYNVLGIGEEGNYTIKKILPKFIIALIVVNFTFVGAKVILDAANVATNAVFALPNTVEEEFNLTKVDQLESAVCGHLDDLGAYGNSINLQGEGNVSMCADDSTFTANARQFFQRLSSNNIALVMAVNLGKIHEGIKVSDLVLQEPSVTNLTINILFSIIIYIVYAISFLALFFVLLVRVVVLWFVIALSPFVAVAIVLPDLVNSGGGNFNIKDIFIKHVTAPIVIGFGMTVGYLMLDAYHSTTGNALGIQLGEQFANGFSGMGSLQQLLIGIGAIAIVWVVTFQAAEGTMANAITRNIKSFAERTGKGIGQLPLTIPIIPVPDTLNEGPVGLGNIGATVTAGLGEINRRGRQPIGIDQGGGGGGNINPNNTARGFTDSGQLDLQAQNAERNPRNLERGVGTLALTYANNSNFNTVTGNQALGFAQAAQAVDNNLTSDQVVQLREAITNDGAEDDNLTRPMSQWSGTARHRFREKLRDFGIDPDSGTFGTPSGTAGTTGATDLVDNDGDGIIDEPDELNQAEQTAEAPNTGPDNGPDTGPAVGSGPA